MLFLYLLTIQSQRAITINHNLPGFLEFQCIAHPAMTYTIVAWLSTILLFPAASGIALAKNICLSGIYIEFVEVIYSFYAAQTLGKLYQSQRKANANINVRCCRCLLPVSIQVLTQPSPL